MLVIMHQNLSPTVSPDFREAPKFSVPSWREIADRAHCVQFYHSDDFLVESVGAFVEAGLDLGEPALVIATAEHRRALERRLMAHGSDIHAAKVAGKFYLLDAAETLQRFMLDGMPDRALFEQTLEPIFSALGNVRVRAFGEMVALLWADGQRQAALQLEALWNQLSLTHRFALLCAYPLTGFAAAGQAEGFAHVCEHHAVVMPAESIDARQGDDAHAREVSRLQQKAIALEAEVAERELAEDALRRRQTTLTMATTLAGLGIWELDLASRELTLCDRSRQILSWPPAHEATFDRLLASVHPDELADARAAFQAATVCGTEFTGEYRVVTDSGVRWIAVRAQRVDSSQRMSGVVLDITAQKNAAAALERTVAERTARLHETIADLEAFSYSISHDMRSPLRAIHGYADILSQECQLDTQHSGYLTRIGAAAQRMDRLIEDVLAFSRVARADLKLDSVDVASLLPPIIEANPLLQAPKAKIQIDGELPQVLGNHAVLTQCLSNLLNNAVKFITPNITPEIRIWAEYFIDTAGQRRARINVRDNGIGIEPGMQEKIFAIFQRLSPNYEGTGIGLAIVKKAIERMDGNVGLQSNPGCGSTFWLELKVA